MSANHRALDENDIALIELVKTTPSLYDPRNVDFRTAHRKDEDWDKVAKSLGLNVSDAKRRWTCLRDRYSRELKLIRLHPGRSSNYGKNEFFRSMDFLRCFVRKRRERRSTAVCNKTEDSFWDTASNGNSEERTFEAKLISVESMTKQENDNKYDDYADSSAGSNYDSKMNLTEETVEFPDYMQGNTETYEVLETTEPHETLQTPIIHKQTTSNVNYNKVANAPLESTISIVREPIKLQKHESTIVLETEDDYFCKSVAVYLRQLSRRHKIKAKVEMFQILEKYIEIEESQSTYT